MATRSLSKDRNGATAVEFAMVVWPLVLLMFGSIEVGRVVWTQTALDKTAIAAARCVGIRSERCAQSGTFDRSLAVSFAQAEASGWGISLTVPQITIEDGVVCDGIAGQSTVTIAAEVFSPLPFIARLLSGSDHVRASACFPTQAAS